MKIKSVRTYQAVTFEKRNENVFTIVPLDNRPNVEISFYGDSNQLVSIKSSKDHVIIPITNISAIYLWNEDDSKREQEKEIEKSKPQGIKAQDIKRPR